MWCFAVLIIFSILHLSKPNVLSNHYCTDMKPQHHVSIEQLLGMWYGVELISHKQDEERLGVRYVDSCPIVHISEDNAHTIPPFQKGNTVYPYGTYYGTENPNPNQDHRRNDYYNNNNNNNNNNYNNKQDEYDQGPYGPNYKHGSQYKTTGQRGSTYYQGRQYGPEDYPKRYADDFKRLRLLWTDNGAHVEYSLEYNVSKPGFWLSSGPQNGSSLDSQFNKFAGTIQVIKAVGNHLVLTFCLRLPDQQLFTILLSRVPRLTSYEISDVHDLLTKRALETHNIKKLCSQNGSVKSSLNFYLILVATFSIISSFKIFR